MDKIKELIEDIFAFIIFVAGAAALWIAVFAAIQHYN